MNIQQSRNSTTRKKSSTRNVFRPKSSIHNTRDANSTLCQSYLDVRKIVYVGEWENGYKGWAKKNLLFSKIRYFSIFCFTITTTLYITIFTRSLPWQLAGLSFWSEPAVLQQLSQSVSHIDPQFWPFEPMTSLWKFSVPPLFVDLWPWLLLLKMPRHFL